MPSASAILLHTSVCGSGVCRTLSLRSASERPHDQTHDPRRSISVTRLSYHCRGRPRGIPDGILRKTDHVSPALGTLSNPRPLDFRLLVCAGFRKCKRSPPACKISPIRSNSLCSWSAASKCIRCGGPGGGRAACGGLGSLVERTLEMFQISLLWSGFRELLFKSFVGISDQIGYAWVVSLLFPIRILYFYSHPPPPLQRRPRSKQQDQHAQYLPLKHEVRAAFGRTYDRSKRSN